MIAKNLKSVMQQMADSCKKAGRPTENVKMICVTKGYSVDDAEKVLAEGVIDLGENRVQELIVKHSVIGSRAKWHLIGHLQTNKVLDAVKIASLIHSVDSLKLTGEIDRQAKKIGKVQDVLIQVNVSGEESKFGLAPDTLPGFLKQTISYTNINIIGLMTMAPESADSEEARPVFRKLKELMDGINSAGMVGKRLEALSMGMSNDFEVAIEEGSTMIRIGRAIFQS